MFQISSYRITFFITVVWLAYKPVLNASLTGKTYSVAAMGTFCAMGGLKSDQGGFRGPSKDSPSVSCYFYSNTIRLQISEQSFVSFILPSNEGLQKFSESLVGTFSEAVSSEMILVLSILRDRHTSVKRMLSKLNFLSECT